MLRFLCVSNLNASKGIFVLLDAAELLLKRTSDFHMHFVGAPTAEVSEERMQYEIEIRGIQKVVTYHGRQYGEDKEKLFAEADCFVHPTLDDCFPLVILEAMQHSLPVIATTVGAIPDMVIDKRTGRLIFENDMQALTNVMLELTEHPLVSEELGRQNSVYYRENFTLELFEKKMISILRHE